MKPSMQALHPQFDIDAFFERVRTAPRRVLMLDYDGTLAPFCEDPARAVPYPGVAPKLEAIMKAGHTRLVIVSGRWTKDLIPLLGLKHLPELWGSHGWERLHTSGDYDTARIRPKALELLVTADDWVTELEAIGARSERKPASIAFHWRGLPEEQISRIRDKLTEKWSEIEHYEELAWHDFDGGIELRVTGRHKGDVVRTIAEESGPDTAIAYLGDDLTDEDAFQALPAGSAAILVRPVFRTTAANLWIRPPEELLAFLSRWQSAAEGHS